MTNKFLGTVWDRHLIQWVMREYDGEHAVQIYSDIVTYLLRLDPVDLQWVLDNRTWPDIRDTAQLELWNETVTTI